MFQVVKTFASRGSYWRSVGVPMKAPDVYVVENRLAMLAICFLGQYYSRTRNKTDS